MAADRRDMERLLIVDDHAGLRELFTFHMEHEGFRVAGAEDGVEGLAMIKSFAPDLVVLDMMMPKLDGMGVLQQLKAEGLSVPVIVVTGYGETYVENAVRAFPNVREYLLKPLNYEDLIARIRGILAPPEK